MFIRCGEPLGRNWNIQQWSCFIQTVCVTSSKSCTLLGPVSSHPKWVRIGSDQRPLDCLTTLTKCVGKTCHLNWYHLALQEAATHSMENTVLGVSSAQIWWSLWSSVYWRESLAESYTKNVWGMGWSHVVTVPMAPRQQVGFSHSSQHQPMSHRHRWLSFSAIRMVSFGCKKI